MSSAPGVCFGGFYFSHNGSGFPFNLTGFMSMRVDSHKLEITIRTEDDIYIMDYRTLEARDHDANALSRLIMVELQMCASVTHADCAKRVVVANAARAAAAAQLEDVRASFANVMTAADDKTLDLVDYLQYDFDLTDEFCTRLRNRPDLCLKLEFRPKDMRKFIQELHAELFRELFPE
jgi:hypothetical protein